MTLSDVDQADLETVVQQIEETFADLRAQLVHERAVTAQLLAACRSALDWYGLDGDHISDPARSQLLAAIAKAERR